mmetsp:Transcript_99867/g.308074  ORF Transcript_99867/g.308074 Transcript_99867/m.308074 type:complete len:234 (-) Transcript_99867:101-802(-)
MPVTPSPRSLVKRDLKTSLLAAFAFGSSLRSSSAACFSGAAALLPPPASASTTAAATDSASSLPEAAAAFRFRCGSLACSASSSSLSGASGMRSLSGSKALPVTGHSFIFSSFCAFAPTMAPDGQMSTARAAPSSRSWRVTGQTMCRLRSSFSASFHVKRHCLTSFSARMWDSAGGMLLLRSAAMMASLLYKLPSLQATTGSRRGSCDSRQTLMRVRWRSTGPMPRSSLIICT